MKYKREFFNYASLHLNMNKMHLEKYLDTSHASRPDLRAFTPTIIEEREMNAVQLDVFSRLMKDRIIFLGVPIDDYVANVIQAQMLFMESVDSKSDIQLFINSPGGSVTAGFGIYDCLLYTSPSPRDGLLSRMPSSA